MKKVSKELFPGYLVRKDWCNDYVDYIVSPNLLLNKLDLSNISDLDFIIYFLNSFQKIEVVDLRLSSIKEGKPYEEKLKYENLNLTRWLALLKYQVQHKEITSDTDSMAHINNSNRAFIVKLDELVGKEIIKREYEKRYLEDPDITNCLFKLCEFFRVIAGPGAKRGRLTEAIILFESQECLDEDESLCREVEIVWPKEPIDLDMFFFWYDKEENRVKHKDYLLFRILFGGESLKLFYWPYGDTPRYVIAPSRFRDWMDWKPFLYEANFCGYGYNLYKRVEDKQFEECFFGNYQGSYEKAAEEMFKMTEQMYDIWIKGEKSVYYRQKGEDPYSWFTYKYPYKPFDMKRLWPFPLLIK